MRKGLILSVIVILLLIPIVLAASVDDEIQKITHYAEEYEIGNINYVQLLVHIAAAREGMNEQLGATHQMMGGVVKQEQIRAILGEPTEETKWVWVEGEEIESPPWDRRPRFKVKNIINGVRMGGKMRQLANSAQVSPASAEGDAKDLFKLFMKMMGKGDRGPGGPEEDEDREEERGREGGEGEKEPEGWESREEITGEIIGDFDRR
tara:strand:+ start:22 stop:642 length:621 start_codon:yes stop_codon:yes gene_type:complete